MDNNYIDMPDSPPTLSTLKCKFFAYVLQLFFQYGALAISITIWYMYDFFIALLVLVLSYIIVGIIRSKIRNSIVPITQRELQYTDREIAVWFVAKEICYEE